MNKTITLTAVELLVISQALREYSETAENPTNRMVAARTRARLNSANTHEWYTTPPTVYTKGILSCTSKDGKYKTLRIGRYFDGRWHFSEDEHYVVDAWKYVPAQYGE